MAAWKEPELTEARRKPTEEHTIYVNYGEMKFHFKSVPLLPLLLPPENSHVSPNSRYKESKDYPINQMKSHTWTKPVSELHVQ